jgi:N-acetylmuramoyl-L-alanine amidase
MARFGLIAGHGGADPGAILGNRLEKNDNLKFTLAVGELLSGRGHEVIYYREDDRACPAHLSRQWIKETTADFFVCFHRNAYNKKAFGAECWTFNDEMSIKVGNTIVSKVCSAGGFYNRGRKSGGAAWIVSEKPCCQIETGFLDNAGDNELYDANFYAITRAVADALDENFEKGKSVKERTATALDWLNIRVSPSLKGTVLGSIPKGKTCVVLSVEDGWAKVQYSGIKGYSSTDFLTFEEEKKEEPIKEEVKTEASAEEPSYNFLYAAFLKITELLRGKREE